MAVLRGCNQHERGFHSLLLCLSWRGDGGAEEAEGQREGKSRVKVLTQFWDLYAIELPRRCE